MSQLSTCFALASLIALSCCEATLTEGTKSNAGINVAPAAAPPAKSQTPQPCTESQCGPRLGMPNRLCEDGTTVAGPGPCERQKDGKCAWTLVECPAAKEPPEAITPTASDCPDGQPPVQCFAPPCSIKKCPGETICVNDYCGGCNISCISR